MLTTNQWLTQRHKVGKLDRLILRGCRLLGFEIKLTTFPRLTASIQSAIERLKHDRLIVGHAGEHAFPMADRIDAVPFSRLSDGVSW